MSVSEKFEKFETPQGHFIKVRAITETDKIRDWDLLVQDVELDKWLDELRSGNYTQTKGTLWDGVGYCCMGVLCDIYHQQNKEISGWGDDCYFDIETDDFIYCDNLMPPSEWFTKWFVVDFSLNGVEQQTRFSNITIQNALTILNDDYGYTFEQIAEVLESIQGVIEAW